MKEIKQLYTKPVMLGMAFLVGMVLVVGLFVTTKSRAAYTIIDAGDDEFETTDNGETYHNFQASPIKADFFGPGSQQYTGVVPLVGVPLNQTVSDTDTIIHRDQAVNGSGTTTLSMKAMNLRSINPIKVTYTSGAVEYWDVRVNLSTLQASTGSMTINSGGTFDSSLKVWPKFTFTRIPDGTQKVLDTGGSSSGSTAPQSAVAVDDGAESSSEPVATATVAPCSTIAVSDFQSDSRFASSAAYSTAAATTTSCAPVTLTSTNSPWQICSNGKFCVPRPITEQELLASHNASPPGTKKGIAVK